MKSSKPKGHINWHVAAVAGLQIELAEHRDYLTYHPEYPLNRGKRRTDCLIIKAPDAPPLTSPIGRIFRRYNIIDYKGPDESMTISNFFKAQSYALSIPDYLKQHKAIHEITLTLMTHRHPRILISYIRKNSLENTKDPVEKIIDGLYYIHIGFIPVQLIVLPELPHEQYLWLSCLTNHLTKDTPLEQLGLAYKAHEDDPLYQTFLNAVIRANSMKEGDEKFMCEALEELFAGRLEAQKQLGMQLGVQKGVQIGAQEALSKMSSLINKLLSSNRIDDAKRATEDPAYLDSLMAEFKL